MARLATPSTLLQTSCLILFATAAVLAGDDHTYVNNQSSRPIRATTSYGSGTSEFVNRLIEPEAQDGDQYSEGEGFIDLTLAIDGSPGVPDVIPADSSVILFDNDNTGGVDVYFSAYGQTGQKTGNVILSLPAPAPPPDVDFALFSLPDSDNDDIVIVTDPSVISNYPTLNNEASCTSNCLFKRSKDDILNIAVTSNLFRDFTNIVALWSQDSVDSATGAQSNLVTYQGRAANLRIDRQAVNIQITQHGTAYSYNLYAVQVGGQTVASVRVPIGFNVGARRIRNAFLESQRRGGTTTIAVPANAPAPGTQGTAPAVRGLGWLLIAAIAVIGSGG